MTPLFSIIIPAYNSEKFISNCIKSVLNQNFSKINYEIIVVNDGSKDKTLNICKNFNKKNVPLRILNNRRNYGVSYSRNIAIKYALGKYLVFIDSDDLIKKSSLKKLSKLVKRREADLLMSLNLTSQEKKINKIKQLKKEYFFEGKKLNIFFKFLHSRGRNVNFYPWSFIINRKFLIENKIYFKHKIKLFEDQLFTAETLCLAKKILISKDVFHIHEERFGSLCRLMGSIAIKSCLETMNELCKILKSKNLNAEKRFFLNTRLDYMIKYLKLYLIACNKTQLKKIYNFIKKNINNFRVIKSKLLDKISFNSKKIINIFKSLTLFSDNSKLLMKNFGNKKPTHLYIYGFGLFGRILLLMYKKNKFKNINFLDNNKQFHNKKYLGTKILNPNALKKINIKNRRDITVVSSFNDINLSKSIYKSLKGSGLTDYKFIILNWRNIVGRI